MNERIKKLAEQAGIPSLWTVGTDKQGNPILEKFADMIVRECAKVAWYHTPDTEELEYSHLIEDKILKHFGVEE